MNKDALIDRLQAEFGEDLMSAAPDGYLVEQRGKYQGAPAPLARPRTVDDVSKMLAFCYREDISVVPYAGGTGLVGGQVREKAGSVIVSLERMTKIRGTYPAENVIEVEAGMLLADVQAAALELDRLFPLSLASEGSCRIGGNLATNAGGVQVLRYGNARDLCLGIEAVLPNGEVYNGLSRLRKDNTGYDLKNLLIGSEGSLGIITAASLRLFSNPTDMATGFVAVDTVDNAIDLLAHLQSKLDGAITAFELINAESYRFLADNFPDLRQPFGATPEWSVLLEVAGGEGAQLNERLETALIEPIEAGAITDAIIAQSLSQRVEFWTVRETIPLANKKVGAISSHDVSVPISSIPEFITQADAKIAEIGPLRVNCFGHVGDGNLHYNVYPPVGQDRSDWMDRAGRVQKYVHDTVHTFGGSISAEHGIGRMKVADLEKYSDPIKLSMMRRIKDAIDPKGIMNPGVFFPET